MSSRRKSLMSVIKITLDGFLSLLLVRLSSKPVFCVILHMEETCCLASKILIFLAERYKYSIYL
jgi:hypothetical protein